MNGDEVRNSLLFCSSGFDTKNCDNANLGCLPTSVHCTAASGIQFSGSWCCGDEHTMWCWALFLGGEAELVDCLFLQHQVTRTPQLRISDHSSLMVNFPQFGCPIWHPPNMPCLHFLSTENPKASPSRMTYHRTPLFVEHSSPAIQCKRHSQCCKTQTICLVNLFGERLQNVQLLPLQVAHGCYTFDILECVFMAPERSFCHAII